MNETNKKIWFYFTVTVVVSYLPSLIRFFLSLGTDVAMYDAKDTLFASFALVISNFTLIGDNESIQKRKSILFGSVLLLIPILIFTIVLMLNEKNVNYKQPVSLMIGTYTFSIISMLVSFGANNNVYQTENNSV